MSRFVLIEYVRRLEEGGLLSAVPTASPRREVGVDETIWLWQRAQSVDKDGRLQAQCQRVLNRAAWLKRVWLMLCAAFGISSTVGLMHAESLNFFYVLLSVLGMNLLMLLWWLATLRHAPRLPPLWDSVLLWRIGSTEEQRLLQAVYEDALRPPQGRWHWGRLHNGAWLASLCGGLLGLVVMLLVRQYTFLWQSTLLDSSHLHSVVAVLAWLPQAVGLSVPDAAAVAASQSVGQVAFSRLWATLLWSSLLLYGIVPRLLAWAVCVWHVRRSRLTLPLDKPYYRRLQRQSRRDILDSAADYRADAARTAPRQSTQTSAALPCLIIAWEVLPDAQIWAECTKRPVTLDEVRVIDGRDAQAALLQELEHNALALDVWVRLASVPDRGGLRRLSECADRAQGGMTVYLWGQADDERVRQWHAALDAQAIAWQNAGGAA